MIIATLVTIMTDKSIKMYTFLEPDESINPQDLMTIISRIKRMILRRPFGSGVGVIRDMVTMLEYAVPYHCRIDVANKDYSVQVVTSGTMNGFVNMTLVVKCSTYHIGFPILWEDGPTAITVDLFAKFMFESDVIPFSDQEIMGELMEFLHDYSEFEEMVDE